MRLIFRKVRLVDASLDGELVGDIVIEDGRIAALGPGSASRAEPAPAIDIDCTTASPGGKPLVLMPAFVDLHAHFREPGFSEKETIESGCLAAVAGGFGTVVAMANTKPATDDPSLALAARARADALGLVDYLPALAATRGLDGRDVSHLDALEAFLTPGQPPGGDRGRGDAATLGARPAGARSWLRLISDDGRDSADDPTLLAAMRKAAALGLLVACHCERGTASPPDGRDAAEWYSSTEGMMADRLAEIRGVERAVRLAREAGCALHLCHLSTRESVEIVRKEKARGANREKALRLSCEATPHHIALDARDAWAAGSAGAGRVNPWLRSLDDRLALLEGLRDGTIDAIATDHAPHRLRDKAPSPGALAAPGFSGLETAFGLVWATLHDPPREDRMADEPRPSPEFCGLGLSELSRLMSAGPASVLGLGDRGRLAIGLRADLVLVDPDAEWRVDSSRFRSRGRNSLLEGRNLRGRVLMTLHEGRIVYDQF